VAFDLLAQSALMRVESMDVVYDVGDGLRVVTM
jgi:hypothetical protein